MENELIAIWRGIVGTAQSETGRSAILVVVGAGVAWIGNFVSGWWKTRDRYQASVTQKEGATRYGPQDQPVIKIQSIHTVPINVTRIRLLNGYRWQTSPWPFAGDDPDDFPDLPYTIEPMGSKEFWLDRYAFERAFDQSKLLKWFWVPRVYISVETMGRRSQRFDAEGGLPYNKRRRRYR